MILNVQICVCSAVFQFDPGFQEDPSQPFSESDDDINDTDDGEQCPVFFGSRLLNQFCLDHFLDHSYWITSLRYFSLTFLGSLLLNHFSFNLDHSA